MIVLNLKANDNQQERLKAYLQENASEILADKINKGVKIEKDGKQLISKKDLDGFLDYACKTAQEQAEKGKRSAIKIHKSTTDIILRSLYILWCFY